MLSPVSDRPPNLWARLDDEAPILGGVASRLSGRFGAGAGVIRLALAIVTMAGGVGVAVYAIVWLLLYQRTEPPARTETARHNLGIMALATAAVALILNWFPSLPSTLIWAVHLTSFGLVISAPRTVSAGPSPGRGGTVARVIAGVVFVGIGWGSLVAGTADVAVLWRAVPAAAVMVAGLIVVLWPWLNRLIRTAELERSERIRAEERSAVAAHLHDSVLQTLTLIQNRASEPHLVASLAHQQERELRRWLYGHRDLPAQTETLRSALEDIAADIERQYLIVIECIVVGDMVMDPPAHAAIAATREALINAGKFAGTPLVSLYAEVNRTEVEIYVRDRGQGFEPALVPSDRRGLRDSVEGRIHRIGGTVTVRSSVGSGTEIHLRIPRSAQL